MVIVSVNEIKVYGICFMIDFMANICSASQPFIVHTRLDRGFMNLDTIKVYLR